MKTTCLSALCLLLLSVTTVFSQDMRATTDDGQSIMLKKNGTWFFVNHAPTEDGSATTFDGHVVILNKSGTWLLTNATRPVPSAAQPRRATSVPGSTSSNGDAHPFLAENAIELATREGTPVQQTRITSMRLVLVYFSAHWCPPCRAFTPEFVRFYNEKGGGEKFEVLFVSSDHSAQEMMGYMAGEQMPWVGVRWKSSGAVAIQKKYSGPGIPCLVLLNDNDQVISDSYEGENYLGPEKVLADLDRIISR